MAFFPHRIRADDAHDLLRRRAEAQLGRREQAIDDVGRALDPVIDECGLAAAVDDEQWRRLALLQPARELDVDLGAVVEDACRLPRCVALEPVAEANVLGFRTGSTEVTTGASAWPFNATRLAAG